MLRTKFPFVPIEPLQFLDSVENSLSESKNGVLKVTYVLTISNKCNYISTLPYQS